MNMFRLLAVVVADFNTGSDCALNAAVRSALVRRRGMGAVKGVLS